MCVLYIVLRFYGVKLDFVSERTIKDHHHQGEHEINYWWCIVIVVVPVYGYTVYLVGEWWRPC